MEHDKVRSKIDILICLIQIWNMEQNDNPLHVPKKTMLITECDSINIDESYKKLISTATVRFPRGTIVYTTETPENKEEINKKQALNVCTDSAGVVEEITKSMTKVLEVSNFSIGQRIRIYLGYTDDNNIAKMGKLSCINSDVSIFNGNPTNLQNYIESPGMHLMFDGYISQIGMESPIELSCENLASKLKTVSCASGTILSPQDTVNCLLSDSGTYKKLKGTGLKLHPKTEEIKFDLGKINLPANITVADILNTWASHGIYSFVKIENGQPYLTVGRNYFWDAKYDSVAKIAEEDATIPIIDFNYHVANNNLELTYTDRRFLAVEAQGIGTKDKFIKLDVIKNYDNTGEPYRIVNKKEVTRGDAKRDTKTVDVVNMDTYSIIPYTSSTYPITMENLAKEAYQYLEQYNTNGIKGNLTIFGDLGIHTAQKVELVDNRHSNKNGVYFIDSVKTSFGVGGFRQTINLPYCLLRKNKDKK